jgi:hypothetical protein
MQSKTKSGYHEVGISDQPITIERREIIGTIYPSSVGKNSMIGEAFLMAGEWLGEHAASDGEPLRLQFEYGSRTWVAAIEGEEAYFANKMAEEDER